MSGAGGETTHVPCIEIRTPWSTCTLSTFGAQVLSFRPAGGAEMLWMTRAPRPRPAAIRGGVPLCWPWFGRQGVAPEAPQHGTARTMPWRIVDLATEPDGAQTVRLAPDAPQPAVGDGRASALEVTLSVRVARELRMVLATHNASSSDQPLTQAFHNYFALGDVARARIEGLAGLPYLDHRAGGAPARQDGEFPAPAACDRVYHGFADDPSVTLVDGTDGRRIRVSASGSRSLVVWNPGADLAAGLPDVPAGEWPRFVCIEPSNAGPDARTLVPGETHRLRQTIELLEPVGR